MSKCLVVDDSRTIRKAIISILNELRVESREAENGAKALEMCAADMPDFIMLDWNMPVLDGLGFLKQLRATPAGKQPKVVFCTTETDLTLITQALSEGADEYIMKPFTREIVEEKLKIVGILPS
ncbi:MAG: response regulator [Rhodobacteraceae bacterium]|nr:response regulator [Paracoccaceae bacterium]